VTGVQTCALPILLSLQLDALLLVSWALAHQLGEAADLGQRHPGPPQLDGDQQPVHLLLAIAAMSARPTGDVLGELQALALVEPQCMHGEPRTPRDLADAQSLFEISHKSDDSPLT